MVMPPPPLRPTRIHVGCGERIIPEWCNLDLQHFPGVDQVVDVTAGLPFDDLELIFCEHFIEHLELDEGIRFLYECHNALRRSGVLRLSTPNIDWVVITHFHPAIREPGQRIRDVLMLNRAFHGWGHRFLYNAEFLTHLLERIGFRNIRACEYGESSIPGLRGLERHPRCESVPGLPDVVILEATRGRRRCRQKTLDRLLAEAVEQYLHHLDWKLPES